MDFLMLGKLWIVLLLFGFVLMVLELRQSSKK